MPTAMPAVELRETSISPPPPRKRARLGPRALSERDAIQPTTRPSASRLRIFSWNVNGIAPFLQKPISAFFASSPTKLASVVAPTASLRAFLQRHHWPQILGLQEVKISPDDFATQAAVRAAVNPTKTDNGDDGPAYVVHFSLPRDKFNATGFGRKVYGVAVIIRKDFYDAEVKVVKDVDWDLEGRVLVVETHCKLSIWTLYCVNGTTNPYRDPQNGTIVGTRHDRKLAFHENLLKECKKLESMGYRLVLAGDFNIARAAVDGHLSLRTRPQQHVKNRADFNAKFCSAHDQSLKAVDTFRHLHPNERKYTYHPRHRAWKTSCDRVDLILISSTLTSSLCCSDILETPADRGPSDHVPHMIELDMETPELTSVHDADGRVSESPSILKV